MRHYRSDELLAYLECNDGVVDVVAVLFHVKSCASCAARLREVAADYAVLSKPKTWQQTESGMDGLHRAEAHAFWLRRQRGEAEANVLYDVLTRIPREDWADFLRARPRVFTEFMVARLIAGARAIEEAQPLESLEILDIADSLFGLIPPDQHRVHGSDVLTSLWRARGAALMIIGDYPAALDAFDRAEQFIADDLGADYMRAFVLWGRASVLFQMEKYAEALPVVEEAEATLHAYGQLPYVQQIMILRGAILYEQGDVVAAERLYLSLLADLQGTADQVSLARVQANLACCHLRRGDFAQAESRGNQALALFAAHGLETEKIRTEWAFAKARVLRGEADDGLAALHRVARAFRERGLEVDAATVELDIIEILLERHAFRRAAAIARRLVVIFSRANAQLSVTQVLSYLRTAIEAENATPPMLAAVRHVLSHPHQPFRTTPQDSSSDA